MILCWNEGQSSAIHDHADSHCFLKVLKGSLLEVKYAMPNEETTSISNMEPNVPADIGVYNEPNSEYHGQPLLEIARTPAHENQVCYINGEYLMFISMIYSHVISL